MIRILVYAADPERRAALAATVRRAPDLRLAGTAADPHELDRALEEARLDVLLADAPDGGAALDAWLPDPCEARVVLLVDAPDERTARAALDRGVRALLPRGAPAADIALAAAAAVRSLALLPARLLARLAARTPPGESDAGPLTPREREVLAALADGHSNKAIARRLGISFHTVKFHVAAILAKLGAETRTEAVAEGARRGMVML